MTISPIFDTRRILPRWRDSRITLSTGELLPVNPNKPIMQSDRNFFNEKIEIWNEFRQIEYAAEVVSAAISQGYYTEAIEAAEFLISESSNTTQTVISIAEEVLVRSEKKLPVSKNSDPISVNRSDMYFKIHNLRNQLNNYPHNAIKFVDLSLAYAILGQLHQSKDAMVKALIVSPDNRFVLRSATRLFIHLGEPDQAHKILLDKEISRHDPWLIAAEIVSASVAKISPKLIGIGKDILERGKFSPFNTTELTSALATIELSAGAAKKARKLFQLSLREPTENSVAQSVWAKNVLPSLDLEAALQNTRHIHEAKSLEALRNLNWSEVVKASKSWLADELFSSRPAEVGSYAASIGLDNFQLAEEFARIGLIANPYDHSLINNLAFALANQDKLDEAEKILNDAPKTFENSFQEVPFNATRGLINIRKGNIDEGKYLYLQAIALADVLKRRDLQAMASIYYAREMFKASKFSKQEAVSFAENARNLFPYPHINWLFDKLQSLTISNK